MRIDLLFRYILIDLNVFNVVVIINNLLAIVIIFYYHYFDKRFLEDSAIDLIFDVLRFIYDVE